MKSPSPLKCPPSRIGSAGFQNWVTGERRFFTQVVPKHNREGVVESQGHFSTKECFKITLLSRMNKNSRPTKIENDMLNRNNETGDTILTH